MLDSAKLSTIPDAPGVYLMKGTDGTTLYVGKAKSLRKRVRSYFGPSGESRYHIQFLMARVADIDWIVTDTEKEAFLLENTLIKRYRPRYNMNLRDDKTFFSLRMDMTEEFPRLTIVRKVARDGARHFGPYTSAAAARETLKQLYKIFPLRHYPLETCRRRRRPCLFFQLKQCSAPCHNRITPADYRTLAEGAALFLEGKNQSLTKIFREKMQAAAVAERYEEAARYRDLLRALEETLQKQKMVTGGGDADVLGICRDGALLSLCLLFIRGGTLIGSRALAVQWEMDDAEGIASFLNEYYHQDVPVPDEVLLPLPIPGSEALSEILSERRGRRTTVAVPRRGTKAELVLLAAKNAASALREHREQENRGEAVLAELRDRLHLRTLPRRIECYDISTFQGRYAVGSQVLFRDARPDKAGYRHYRIRTVAGADDFAMLREVFSRRFKKGLAENDLPDLIMVDGGIGQLNILTRVLHELGVTDVAAASLAKSRIDRDMASEELARSDERVFLPGRKNPVVMRQNSAPLLLLARIRDEAHRFAITYHQKLRGKGSIASMLDSIPGIGPSRRRELLNRFGSLQRLQDATRDELAAVPGISATLADAILTAVHENEKSGISEMDCRLSKGNTSP
jgi:excinuclease ABC subunit C